MITQITQNAIVNNDSCHERGSCVLKRIIIHVAKYERSAAADFLFHIAFIPIEIGGTIIVCFL